MTIDQIRENIKNRVYTASDPILDPIAYPSLHRLNPVQASEDERVVARAKLRKMGDTLIEMLRCDVEIAFNTLEHTKAETLWLHAWEEGHAYGLYEVLNSYERLMDVIL